MLEWVDKRDLENNIFILKFYCYREVKAVSTTSEHPTDESFGLILWKGVVHFMESIITLLTLIVLLEIIKYIKRK